MKLFSVMLVASTLVLAGSGLIENNARAEGNGQWVCKTAPIWNGRTSYPRFATGSTKEEAYARAVAFCAHSGYASYCESVISCWQQ